MSLCKTKIQEEYESLIKFLEKKKDETIQTDSDLRSYCLHLALINELKKAYKKYKVEGIG